MIRHCVGKSQINFIPAWSKEFSYITFLYRALAKVYALIHQSIPAVPILPWATAGHLLTLSLPGVGHSQFYRGPGGWALAYPGAIPGHLTRVFKRHISLSGGTRPLSKTGLFIRDQKNLSMFLRVSFLNFRYFFITCKHVNISDQVNYILFITKQSLT